MGPPPILVDDIDAQTSLLIAQLVLEDIDQDPARLHDGSDEGYALTVMAEDYRQFLRAYDDYQTAIPISLEPFTSFAVPTRPLVTCIACADTIPPSSAFLASCGHHYCPPCLEQLLLTSTTVESLFPPWCCNPKQRIDVYQLMTPDGHTLPPKSGGGPAISEDLCRRLFDKLVENGLPHKERVYCPNPKCSVFMGSKNVLRERGPQGRLSRVLPTASQCRVCLTWVCLGCKKVEHPGECEDEDDDEDEDSLAVRDLAKRCKWRRCPGCRYVVEKAEGCDRIPCRCKMQFCYQ